MLEYKILRTFIEAQNFNPPVGARLLQLHFPIGANNRRPARWLIRFSLVLAISGNEWLIKGVFREVSVKFIRNQFGKSAAALFLSGLVLVVSLLAASPALHQAVHTDANSPDHQCAVTLFAHGQLTPAPDSQVLVVIAALFAVLALRPQGFLPPSADYRFSASRAPPAFVLV